MKEIEGDLWAYHGDGHWVCVPTNGRLNSEGHLVMGAGVAGAAKKKFPNLPWEAGKLVDLYGNIPFSFAQWRLITFPTKRDFRENSSLRLIGDSAHALVGLTERLKLEKVYLPRVGAGLGGLPWEDVREVISPVLDERFVVVTLGGD